MLPLKSETAHKTVPSGRPLPTIPTIPAPPPLLEGHTSHDPLSDHVTIENPSPKKGLLKTMTTEAEEHMLLDESPITNPTNMGQPNCPTNICSNTEDESTDLGFDYSKILVKSNPNTPTASPAITSGPPSWTYQSIETEMKMKLEQLAKSLTTMAKLHHTKEMALARKLPPRGMQLHPPKQNTCCRRTVGTNPAQSQHQPGKTVL